MSQMAQRLQDAFADASATVTIIGLGYVGLPLSVEIAKAGFTTYGFDISDARVAKVNAGTSPVMDVSDDDLAALIDAGTFSATTDPSVLGRSDAVIICVPTPLQGNKEPDMRFIDAAARSIARYPKKGRLVVLESTSYPGTTDGLLADVLREGGAEVDVDTFLAFGPERVDPGNRSFKTKNIPKVVGGVSPLSTQVAAAFYRRFLNHVHEVSSARVAETSKLLENTFRAVNIAMVNELAQLCHELDVDVWEVIAAADTKPFGFMAFYPGPGVGGHCIPLDPHYLAWSARLTGFEPRFIHIADQVNSAMPRYVVTRLVELLNDHEKPLKGTNVLVFGVAYKRDADDARESPALEVMHLLESKGARVQYVDPFVRSASFKGHEWTSRDLNDETLTWADVGLVLTDHTAFDWDSILDQLEGPILDTRNTVGASDRVARL